MKIDKKLIKELTEYLNEFNLTELEYGNNDLNIKVSKATNISKDVKSSPDINEAKIIATPEPLGIKITSPIIGTAYLSPEPGAKKFIEVGNKVKKGDTIMIVEAMKTMNHVPASSDGIVKEVCVEDGQPVEYGQVIVILK